MDETDYGDDLNQYAPINNIKMKDLEHGVVYNADPELDLKLYDLSEEGESDDGYLFKGTKHKLKEPPPSLEQYELIGCNPLTTDRGVLKQVFVPGIGNPAKPGSRVSFLYAAYCENAKIPFDSSIEHSKPTTMIIGESCFIPGLTRAIESMRFGELSQFFISYEWAYGEMGCPPRIPPKANIFFNVEIKEITSKQEMEFVENMDHERRAELSFSQILQGGIRFRNQGNEFYWASSYQSAVRAYRQAIDLVEDYWILEEKDVDLRNEFLEKSYANLAAAYLKLLKAPQACNACKAALKFGSTKLADKVYIRFARALAILHEYNAAINKLKSAATVLEGGEENSIYKKELKEILRHKKTAEAAEATFSRNMFGNGTECIVARDKRSQEKPHASVTLTNTPA